MNQLENNLPKFRNGRVGWAEFWLLLKLIHYNIDGKTIRGSRNDKHKAYHVVSAWVAENQIILGEIKTEEKSNEITAVPKLLDMDFVSGYSRVAEPPAKTIPFINGSSFEQWLYFSIIG